MVGPKTLTGSGAVPDYEKMRLQRIQENQARMQQMGIFDLSRQLQSSKPKPPSQPKPHHPSAPTRRSSRLQNVAPVNYVVNARNFSAEVETQRRTRMARRRDPSQNVANPNRKRRLSDSETDSQADSGSHLDLDSSGSDDEVKVRVQLPNSGSPPRRSTRLKDVSVVSYVETSPKKVNESSESENSEGESLVESNEEHEEMVDDGMKDEICHQCRKKKALGELTRCNKCDLVQRIFCGDCLDMIYGENVIEVNQNPAWVCLVCRGICSCNVCLNKELMHDESNKKMEEECLNRKDVNILGSKHIPADDICKLDCTIAWDAGGEAKKDTESSTEMSSTHVGTEDLDKLMTDGDVDTTEEARSTRTSYSHVAEDLGKLEAATDADGETKTERRSTRMRKN